MSILDRRWPLVLLRWSCAALRCGADANEYFFFAGFVVLQFVVLATAWNILGGYAGYVNFGTAAFFGVGAYTAVLLFKALGAPLARADPRRRRGRRRCSGFGVGLLTLRLRGIFFSIATVAVIFIVETVVINWRYVGGATGAAAPAPGRDCAVRHLHADAVRGDGRCSR